MDVLTLKPLLNTSDLFAEARVGFWAPTAKMVDGAHVLIILTGDSFTCDSTFGTLRRKVCKNIWLLYIFLQLEDSDIVVLSLVVVCKRTEMSVAVPISYVILFLFEMRARIDFRLEKDKKAKFRYDDGK